MPRRTTILCLTIVAAFGVPLTAAPSGSVSEAPVSAPAVAAAEMLGLDPVRDRARFLAELTRRLYTPPEGRSDAVDLLGRARPSAAAAGAPLRIPVPLSAEIWSDAVFRRRISGDQLVNAILSDRKAALIAHALTALDADTLAYLERAPALLRGVYERGATAFGVFGSHLRIRDGRIVPPGGDAAVPLWEAVVGERVSAPDRFVRALYGSRHGRLAYLYDLVSRVSAPAAAFVLGLWMPDAQVRTERFEALAAVCADAYPEWDQSTLPFSRPLHDLALLLVRMRFEPSGAPPAPASRAFWSAALENHRYASDGIGDGPIDAAWLAAATGRGDMHWRHERLEQFSFGHRLVARTPAADWNAAHDAIRAFPRQRMLMLTLERLGVDDASIYQAAVRTADAIGTSINAAFWTMSQLQGALAIVVRAHERGSLDRETTVALVASLLAVPIVDSRYDGRLASWIDAELVSRFPLADSAEERVLAGLAGPPPAASAPAVAWEGQRYRLDFAAAERRRLESIRRKQAGYTLDFALEVARLATLVAGRADQQDAAHAVAEALLASAPPDPQIQVEPLPRGMELAVSASSLLSRTREDLAAGLDERRSAEVAAALRALADQALGQALLSLAYAAHIGDPNGAPMLARNVALRHDFGFHRPEERMRARARWDVPRPDFLPGVPWHITGSALGLELALAPQMLRRISLDRVLGPPRLASNQREGFAVGVALMNPRRLRDADAAAIADAVGRGSRRVSALAADAGDIDAVSREVALDGRRRQSLAAAVEGGERETLLSQFSLVELMRLGGGAAGADLDAWGMPALVVDGCICTRLIEPSMWPLLEGRPQLTLMAAAVPDLNIHVAIELHELGLPAALAPQVLAAAMQDFIDEVAPYDFDDWWTVAHAARAVDRARIEDYVAAAAAVDGPLMPIAEDVAEEKTPR